MDFIGIISFAFVIYDLANTQRPEYKLITYLMFYFIFKEYLLLNNYSQ